LGREATSDLAMARDAMARGGLSNVELLLPHAYALVRAEWPRIEIIAEALVQYRRLDHAEVVALIRGN
jgi:hypothetical protein